MFPRLPRARFVRTLFAAIAFFSPVAQTVRGQSSSSSVTDLDGHALDPFHRAAGKIVVLLFVRTDCPLTNRYAPELQRISAEFSSRGVDFWLVYPDPAESTTAIENHIAEYHLPGTAVRDPQHRLVSRAEATVAPQAALFDAAGRLVYTGRIDDRFVEFGKSRPAPRTHDLEDAMSALLAGKTVSTAKTRAIGCFLADVKP